MIKIFLGPNWERDFTYVRKRIAVQINEFQEYIFLKWAISENLRFPFLLNARINNLDGWVSYTPT